MGLIILIVPLIIYYVIIVPIIKKKLINKKITNPKLRNLAFILLLLFPIGDHIIGYGVYKALCYTNGGVKIYKTVTDEQEQRDYWIDTYKQKRPLASKGERYGIEGRIYLANDLKYHKTVYINNCKTKRWKSYDCKKAEEYIKNNNIDIYSYIKEEDYFPRNKKYTDHLEEANIEVISLINEKDFTLERAYFNKCNNKYNTLSKTDPNYKKSCTNADEIIKKYNLKNVIKVPASSYIFYNSTFDKSYNYNIVPFLEVTLATQMIKDYKTNEILAINKEYAFGGGWYVNLVSPYPFGIGCSKNNLYDFHTQIIPNPYKNKK
ncbi:hypothetical protein HUE87_04330 [Candidatus Sulfurimonas marisnigri]|uniref:Uncharacterized protein n=1 Tax=Candidatus Sulfurimonas marisnigri TaxID=2740405 RepID=A0A7S7RRA8_9BACT|nr:hypothetical protein [Candidatus Sulfurimonas marisnigri]QOY55468.1 hypothetical protein HUE87_04330 [Candidatus Sulfurimonas marisnigri]